MTTPCFDIHDQYLFLLAHRNLKLIVTGGHAGRSTHYYELRSVEVLQEDGSPWCSLPDLPGPRRDHSQSGDQSLPPCLQSANLRLKFHNHEEGPYILGPFSR